MTEQVFREGRFGVDDRVALINQAFAQRALGCAAAAEGRPGEVHFEIDGEAYTLTTVGGVPQRLARSVGRPEWAILVDDWDLIVPVAPVRGVTELAGCGLRLGDESWPLPLNYEVEHWTPECFAERIPNAQLYFYAEAHGSPAGSVSFAVLLDQGLPRFSGDKPDPPDSTPRLAMGASFPQYLSYRTGTAHQLSVTAGAWIDGNWKDLLVLHGLFDMPGFGRIYEQYPKLPQELWDYMWVLAEAAKLPQAKSESPVEASDSSAEAAPA